MEYDNIGIGSNVKSEINRLIETGIIKREEVKLIGWNAGSKVIDPYYHIIPDDKESPMNGDFFYNIKAQAWWSLRTRVYKTFQFIKHQIKYRPEEMISISSKIAMLYQLLKELAQPTRGLNPNNLKMIVEKKPDGTKSPNLGDAAVMCYFPIIEVSTAISVTSGS